MNRTAISIITINLLGVLVLAGICAWQWRGEALLLQEVACLRDTVAERDTQIGKQENAIEGISSDRDFFRGQFAETEIELAATNATLEAARREKIRMDGEIERQREIVKQLHISLESWRQAVDGRDKQLAEANKILREAAEAQNDAVRRHNELATRHNELVKLLNESRKALAQSYRDLDDARRKLYRALGQPLPEPLREPPAKTEPDEKKEAQSGPSPKPEQGKEKAPEKAAAAQSGTPPSTSPAAPAK
ncbi:MAG: hypothetical protein LBT53_05795 [Puniceicoccales bacterium]|jgi:chromosome segregation ATPase|nr:hypothetical protein [Puniceicoccales bacterium]